MKETVLQRQILDLLHINGIFAWRQNNGAVYDARRGCYRSHSGMRGVPDILMVLKGGVLCGVECKSATGKESPDQKEFARKANGLGALVFTARSLADVRRELGL